MATIKSFTSLNQSKKLAEILPLKSADMHYERAHFEGKQSDWFVKLGSPIKSDDILPCWSLAALLGVLPHPFLSELSNEMWKCGCYPSGICYYVAADSPIDACYEMILKLHELNLL